MPATVVVVRDLLFSSRITGTAAAQGASVTISSTVEALTAALDAGGVRLVMVDMSLPENVSLPAIQHAAGHAGHPRVLAFYSHVDTRLRDAALAAGATEAMPRSKFVSELPGLLSGS